MNLFEAQYSFKDLHESSDVLNRTRVNQWRLRGFAPATVESQGSGYPAKFSLWDLIHVEALALLSKHPDISVTTANKMLLNARKIIRHYHNEIIEDSRTVGIEKLIVEYDAGSKGSPIVKLQLGDKMYYEDEARSPFTQRFCIGFLIRMKISNLD